MLNKNTEQIDFSFHVLFSGMFVFRHYKEKKIFLVLNAFQILVKMYLHFLIMPSNKSESKSNSKNAQMSTFWLETWNPPKFTYSENLEFNDQKTEHLCMYLNSYSLANILEELLPNILRLRTYSIKCILSDYILFTYFTLKICFYIESTRKYDVFSSHFLGPIQETY